MKRRPISMVLGLLLLLTAALAFARNDTAKDKKSKPDTKLTKLERENIIRTFLAEQYYVHRLFPRGMVGLRIENDVVTPSEAEVRQLVADNGAACRPGDQAKITNIDFKDDAIVFELNGGPVKKKKWYQRLQLSAGGNVAVTPTGQRVDSANLYTNANGSFVALEFKGHVPSLTPAEVKQMLTPVFDFKAVTMAEAYENSLPPKLAEAVKKHEALVGMDRDMVVYALGRPPNKTRETDKEGREYEEWIYGKPPENVQFVRFIGDRVVRIETMMMDGKKIVRTKDEVGDLYNKEALARKEAQQKEAETPTNPNAPSLMRPGEQPVNVTPSAPVRPQTYPPPPTQTNPGSGIPDPSQQTPGNPPPH